MYVLRIIGDLNRGLVNLSLLFRVPPKLTGLVFNRVHQYPRYFGSQAGTSSLRRGMSHSPISEYHLPTRVNFICMTLFNATSLTPILISRFILNLRQVGEANKPPSRPSRMASIVFRIQESIVGNMGESLEHGPGGDGEEVEEVEHGQNGPTEEVASGEAGDILEDVREPEFVVGCT